MSSNNSLWDRSLFAYKTPKYLVDAIKKKYGQNIKVIGATKKNIDDFWGKVGFRVDQTSKPVEKAKTVVNIDTRTHSNTANREGTDWYDDFVITSKKSVDEKRKKTYNLHLEKATGWSVGGDISIASPGFFNLAGPGVTPKLGANAKYSKTKTTSETQSKHAEDSLSQGYEIVDTLKVPPNTTVKAKITTYAVTYEFTAVTRLSVDPKAHIRVCYYSYNIFGGFWKTDGIITAEDLFTKDGEKSEGNITIMHDSKVSYLGEEVEVHKTTSENN